MRDLYLTTVCGYCTTEGSGAISCFFTLSMLMQPILSLALQWPSVSRDDEPHIPSRIGGSWTFSPLFATGWLDREASTNFDT